MPLVDPITNILDQVYFKNTLGTWLSAVLVALATLVIVGVARMIIKRRVHALTETTTTQIDDFIVEALHHTRRFFLFTLALYMGTRPLTLPDRLESFVHHFTVLFTLLQIGIWSDHAIRFWLRRYVQERM